MNQYIAMAFLAGAVLPLQVAVNTAMSRHLESALASSFISYLGGILSVGILYFLTRPQISLVQGTLSAPLWMLSGGMLGAIYVTSAIYVGPKIGATTLMALVIAGQLIFSTIFDHFGLAGLNVKPISLQKVAGVIVLMIGAYWVMRSN